MEAADGSVTEWLLVLRGGGQEAARRLWGRYYQRMVRLVQQHLRRLGATLATAIDAEDVALEAFRRFCEAHQQGRFPELNDRRQLWPLLVTIALNRTRDALRAEAAEKRGAGQAVIPESQLTPGPGPSGGVTELDQLPGREPPPDLAALMADECRRLLEILNDPELEQLALWKLDGLTDDEIAAKLNDSRRTVQRMLRVIRITWEQDLDRRDPPRRDADGRGS